MTTRWTESESKHILVEIVYAQKTEGVRVKHTFQSSRKQIVTRTPGFTLEKETS